MISMLKATLSYDGTSYFGWQKTKTGPSIQETLEKALYQILRRPLSVEAASRTDRGVHAKGQVVHFDSKEKGLLKQQLNGVLPHDIRVSSIEEKAPDFHATLSAKGKEYIYSLCCSPSQLPMHRLYSWHFPYPLDLEKMRKSALDLVGTRDFSPFAGEKKENPFCTLTHLSIEEEENRLKFVLQGDRFLYKMVRTLVGTLVYIGCGKLPADGISRIKDRAQAGMTAPAHGLFLSKVFY